jgi:hypothetical protein
LILPMKEINKYKILNIWRLKSLLLHSRTRMKWVLIFAPKKFKNLSRMPFFKKNTNQIM